MLRHIIFVLILFLSMSLNAQISDIDLGVVCQNNNQCASKLEYCAKLPGQCGFTSSGSCTVKPEICTFEYAPVCGCDNITYSNTCAAAAAGVNVSYTGECNDVAVPPDVSDLKPKSDQYLIARARHAVKDCIKSARQPGWDIVSSVHTVSACFAGGYITDVNFAKQIHCPPNEPLCPQAPLVQVATVQFGCTNEVISSQCFINQCIQDSDCESGKWCRPDEQGSSSCVNFVGEGDRCEGFVMPSFMERCEPGLTCVPTEPTFDAPGICATCNYNGAAKFLGDTFLDDDGCNTCTCNQNGVVSCTEMACVN